MKLIKIFKFIINMFSIFTFVNIRTYLSTSKINKYYMGFPLFDPFTIQVVTGLGAGGLIIVGVLVYMYFPYSYFVVKPAVVLDPIYLWITKGDWLPVHELLLQPYEGNLLKFKLIMICDETIPMGTIHIYLDTLVDGTHVVIERLRDAGYNVVILDDEQINLLYQRVMSEKNTK